MPTVAEAELQRVRETVYDVRWSRHRDQIVVLLGTVVMLALVVAAVKTGNVMFAWAALGVPLGMPATLWSIRKLTAPTSPHGLDPHDDPPEHRDSARFGA